MKNSKLVSRGSHSSGKRLNLSGKTNLKIKAKIGARKLAASNRTGSYYVATVNKTNEENKYTNYKPVQTRPIKIGKQFEKESDYEDKLERRVSTKGINRKTMQGINAHSNAVQFPNAELLPNGNHRYYMVAGDLVDRLV